MPPPAKPPSTWQTLHRVTDRDLNAYGLLHGGRLMTLADEAGFHAAFAHAGTRCLTRAVHGLGFSRSIGPGSLIELRACAIMAGPHSIWTWVEAFEHGKVAMSGAFVFVAVDEAFRPVEVPVIEPTNAAERKLQNRVRRLRATIRELAA